MAVVVRALSNVLHPTGLSFVAASVSAAGAAFAYASKEEMAEDIPDSEGERTRRGLRDRVQNVMVKRRIINFFLIRST